MQGALDGSGVFKADTILAKHDETYMPKDVADALKKSGHWKDDHAQRAARPVAEGEVIAEIGHYALMLALGPGADPGLMPISAPAAAIRADEHRGARGVRAIRLRRTFVRGARRLLRHAPISRCSTSTRTRIRRCR